jgi:hypothetical protein
VLWKLIPVAVDLIKGILQLHKYFVCLLLPVLLVGFQSLQAAPARVALVIGNAD